MQQVRRALLAAFVLGGFASLLQLTLPLYALHVFESAVPAASLETLGLLALIAAGTVALWTCITAARDRILLRAGLWLDHTLGRRMLEEGERLGTPPAELEKDMDALAAFTGALAERTLVPALEAPWLALAIVVLGLLHPMMGAVAASCAALLARRVAGAGAPARAPGAAGRRGQEGHRDVVAGGHAVAEPAGRSRRRVGAARSRAHRERLRARQAQRGCCRTRRACCGRARRSLSSRSARGSSSPTS